jgi:hypothetical protein
MSRKHYIALARMFNDTKPVAEECLNSHEWAVKMEQWKEMVERTAIVLADDNPRFDINRFRTACGL